MAVTFYNVNSEAGLQKLNEYLLTRSYITGYQASKDDIVVHAAISSAPSSEYVNVCRWYSHIDALLKLSGVTGEGQGVTIEGSAPPAEEVPSSPAIDDKKAPAAEEDDDDDDVDLFGEETEEEKKAAEERAAAIKASGKKKESGKSSVLLDVKPWDDETDMQKVEEAVRSIKMEGLFWGASKLVPVGYGIKKLQIMMTIVDDLVSVDSLIEEHLTVEPANEYIQSCDIVAFNKICKYIMLRNQLPSSIPWCSRVILISLAPYFTIPYQSFIFDYLTSRKDKPILHNHLYAKGPMGRAVWSPTHGVRTGQNVSCSNPRCGRVRCKCVGPSGVAHAGTGDLVFPVQDW